MIAGVEKVDVLGWNKSIGVLATLLLNQLNPSHVIYNKLINIPYLSLRLPMECGENVALKYVF